jgi:uncharacterized ion transporter superfamily protein YfcC
MDMHNVHVLTISFNIIIIIIIIIMNCNWVVTRGSSPYTSTDKTNKNKYVYIWETIKKYSKINTKHSKYKYTYYQNTHTLQNKLKQQQHKIHSFI